MFARPGLPSFDYVRAKTLDEAVRILQEHGGAARPVMGGTDLFTNMRDGKLHPHVVVDVKGLPGMQQIAYDAREGLTVGAAVTMNSLAAHPDVAAHYPLLAQAAGAVASYQLRNRATLGGNLCNASPCADTAPATLVLDAQFILHGPSGERRLPAAVFFRGPGQTGLQPGEMMTAIHFPPAPEQATARYLKLGRCRSGDLSLVGVAVMVYYKAAPAPWGAYTFRIGLGSVAPTPLRASEAEEFLAASEPGEETFALAAERAMAAARPITDVRGTATYQRAMVRTLTLRALRHAWAQLVF
ncbi:MAG: xanthine dehydrogenase family protein subunit M [Anaerolineae bacterium]|jgi:carbon-monoxide dehydrogenase medium subunit